MPATSLVVDGNDLADQGFYLSRGLRGLLGSPVFNYPSKRPPGRIDALRLSTKPELTDRTLLLPGAVSQDTRADLRSAIAELGARLSPGEHTFVVVDDQTVEFVGLIRELDAVSIEPDLNQLIARATIRVQCLDPRLRAVSDTVVNFTSSLVATPLGNAPVRPVIRITGPATNPTITYADSAGVTVTTMSLTISLADASEWIEIDCAELTIVDETSTNRADVLTSGTFIELNPYEDGDYVAASWPQLSVDSGDGTATYRKKWWAGNG